VIVVIVESVAMSEHGADTPEQVLKFVPTERPRRHGPVVEEAGEAIIAKIQKAAELSNENCDRAMKLAHKLSMQLRAAEERISQLEAEVELFPRPSGPRRRLASNNPERDRGEAHRSEISVQRRNKRRSLRLA
jgi:hypothetical protein